MYSLGMPVSALRTKVRQEFERHRFVNQLPVVDMLLFQSHAEFQVCAFGAAREGWDRCEGWDWGGGEEEGGGFSMGRSGSCGVWGGGGVCLGFRGGSDLLTRWRAGNVELLEAGPTCSEILPGEGEPDDEAASEFHAGVFGGRGNSSTVRMRKERIC